LARNKRIAAQKAARYTEQQMAPNTINFREAQRVRHIELVPKSLNQENYILKLLDPKQHIVIAYLKMGAIERIVLTRPAVGVEDEKHGFLPGDLNSKMEPWTRPLLDVLREYYSPRDIAKMLEDQTVEISPLAFMRGRTMKSAWVIADEMQNATPGQMKMLLTRIGVGSKIVVTGDVEQADRSTRDNGLLDLAERLNAQGVYGLSICKLDRRDCQRHSIIDGILKLYD